MERRIKCYIVEDNNNGNDIFVFAETASKARYLAFEFHTDYFEYEYLWFKDFLRNVSVNRCKRADDHYCGRCVMDWQNPKDRVFLVREFGWRCSDELGDLECKDCPAKGDCVRYDDWVASQKEHGDV